MNVAGLLEEEEFKKIKNKFKSEANTNTSFLKGRGGQANRPINREKQ